VQKVLIDGSTLAAVTRLLYWGASPNALNVFSLSLLIESMILHNTTVALDTSDINDLAGYAEYYNGAVAVHKQGVSSILEDYGVLESPDFDSMRDVLINADFDTRLWKSGSAERAADVISSALWEGRYQKDAEMATYLEDLRRFYEFRVDTRTVRRKAHDLRNTVIGKKIFRRDSPVMRQAILKSFPKEMLLASDEMLYGDDNIMERYTNAAKSSSWQESAMWRHHNRRYFVPRLLIRTHFYLLASDVLGMPYRPDGLRAPICWKFFSGGSFQRYGLDECFIDAAERVTQDHVESINRFLKREAFVLVPFFLTRVLAQAATPDDIISITLEIRESAAARRLRQYTAELQAADDAGDIAHLAREITKYGSMLRGESGVHDGGGIDAALSLLASGADMALSPTPANLLSNAWKIFSGARQRQQQRASWWYRRKTALISKTLRADLASQSLPHLITRVFGTEMAHDELSFLSTVFSGSLDSSGP